MKNDFNVSPSFSTIINAQTDKIKISGKVVDNNSGLAIPNASISVDGNTVTDMDGNNVVVNSAKSVLKIFVGFDTKSVIVGKNTTINVSLSESNQ
jgi:hypothetical protein